jgi:hypothetical protein
MQIFLVQSKRAPYRDFSPQPAVFVPGNLWQKDLAK